LEGKLFALYFNIMSRIGRQPISIPEQVKVTKEDNKLLVTGPNGTQSVPLPLALTFVQLKQNLSLSSTSSEPAIKALHGLTRSLLQNAILGVTSGFERRLELVGTGYRVKLEDSKLILSLGFSHPIYVDTPEGISFSTEGTNIIIIKGNNKQAVGQVAANIRSLRPPEPYKGKGVRYEGEVVRRKAGKTAKGATAA